MYSIKKKTESVCMYIPNTQIYINKMLILILTYCLQILKSKETIK